MPSLLEFRAVTCCVAGLLLGGCVNPGGAKKKPAPAHETDAAAPGWVDELKAIDVECGSDDSTRLYDQRIAPLFEDDSPASCNECHLSGLDLEVFMRDTPCQSMACLVALGWVDPDAPDDSLVLDWIARGSNPSSPLITQEVVEQEYGAFREWIHYSVACEECSDVNCPGQGDAGAFCPGQAEPVLGYEPEEYDPGGCSDQALFEVFRSTVYASRGRCSPCHYNDHDLEAYEAPLWIDVLGDCDSAARRTYWNVLDHGYVDADEPLESLLMLKPLPEDLGGVDHGGHDKFWSLEDDQGYLNFAYFLERYAECR